MSQDGMLVYRRDGGEAVSLQAGRLASSGTGQVLEHCMRRSRTARGDSPDGERGPGVAAKVMTTENPDGRLETCSPTPGRHPPRFPSRPRLSPTPTTGRPCRMPSRLGRCVGDRRDGVELRNPCWRALAWRQVVTCMADQSRSGQCPRHCAMSQKGKKNEQHQHHVGRGHSKR